MTKKIIFVNPPVAISIRYGILAATGAIEPPLGLTYLAAITRRMGFETTILDALALNFDIRNSLRFIFDEKPDFLGIGLTTCSLSSASRLASAVKEKMPGVKIIVGGCHLSSLPKETMLENQCFDIGVIGEGEKTIEQLLKALINKNSLSLVKGIIFRRNGGEIVLTAARERIKNLDDLPMPAFDLLPELKRYYRPVTQSIKHLPTTSLVTSRGCTGKCTFCDRKTFGNEMSFHSAEYIAEMMDKLKKDFNIKGIIFEDDNFMLSEKRLRNLAEILNKKKIKLSWSALSRIDTVTEEKLRIAKSCGCWQILYGIESGSQEILDFYKKGICLRRIKEAVCLAKRCGLYTKGFFMWGNPLENEETLKNTRELILGTPFDDISLTFFTPYPGAEVWHKIDNLGHCDKDWNKFTCFDTVFIPKALREEEMLVFQRKTLKEFYEQPRVVWSYLTRLRSFFQLREFYRGWRALSSYAKTSSNKKELIINADDFGLCHAINAGIFKLLQKDILGSVSVISTADGFEESVEMLKASPSIDLGVHLSLTMTKPVLNKEEIPSLVNREGRFANTLYSFLLRYLFGRINKEHIVKEFCEQINKVRKSGFEITNLNSHQYIHMLPGVFKIMLRLAKRYNISFIRLPCVPLDRRFIFSKASLKRKCWQLLLNLLCVVYRPIVKRYGIRSCSYCFGFLESGHLNDKAIADIVSSLKEGRHELICHPGEKSCEQDKSISQWRYKWHDELRVLISASIKDYARSKAVHLTKFK